MIVLYILLGILLFLLFLLHIPAHAYVTYHEEAGLTLRYLFLRFKILPEEEKKEVPEKAAAKPKKQTAPQEKKPNAFVLKVKRSFRAEGFSGFMELIGQFVKLTGTTAINLIKKLRIREFDLYVMAGGEDAAAAAILYGKACAVIYPATEMLFRLVPCKKHRVSVDLDYSVLEPYVKLEADVLISPISVVNYALRYIWGVIPMLRRFMNPVDRKRTSPNSAKQRQSR